MRIVCHRRTRATPSKIDWIHTHSCNPQVFRINCWHLALVLMLNDPGLIRYPRKLVQFRHLVSHIPKARNVHTVLLSTDGSAPASPNAAPCPASEILNHEKTFLLKTAFHGHITWGLLVVQLIPATFRFGPKDLVSEGTYTPPANLYALYLKHRGSHRSGL